MRITPACAGNKINYSWIKYRSQDHPRVCGEQAIYVCRWVRDEGLPPRVRGTVRLLLYHFGQGRITPACAGNSGFGLDSDSLSEDHPRVCGEQRNFRILHNLLQGSPPRVRGTDKQKDFLARQGRITPACAGNSIYGFLHISQTRDHPRVCGEQPVRSGHPIKLRGSPPRVRGTGTGINCSPKGTRITPACAGNSTFVRGWICSA